MQDLMSPHIDHTRCPDPFAFLTLEERPLPPPSLSPTGVWSQRRLFTKAPDLARALHLHLRDIVRVAVVNERRVAYWYDEFRCVWHQAHDVEPFFHLLVCYELGPCLQYLDDFASSSTSPGSGPRHAPVGSYRHAATTSTLSIARELAHLCTVPIDRVQAITTAEATTVYLLPPGHPATVVHIQPGGNIDHRQATWSDHVLDRHCIRVPYNPNATCPRFSEEVLTRFFPDLETRSFILRFLGQCLLRFGCEFKDTHILVLHGATRTGKSTLCRILITCLAPAGAFVPTRLIVQREGAIEEYTHGADQIEDSQSLIIFRDDISTAKGSSWVFNANMVKTLTRGERTTAVVKYRNAFEFEPRASLIMQTNEMPDLQRVEDAIKDRFWLHQMRGHLADKLRDESYPIRLAREEGEGILALLIAQAAEHRRRHELGDHLAPSAEVADATQSWFEEQAERDPFTQFREYFVPSTDDGTPFRDLYDAYNRMAHMHGWPSQTETSFGRLLRAHEIEKFRSGLKKVLSYRLVFREKAAVERTAGTADPVTFRWEAPEEVTVSYEPIDWDAPATPEDEAAYRALVEETITAEERYADMLRAQEAEFQSILREWNTET